MMASTSRLGCVAKLFKVRETLWRRVLLCNHSKDLIDEFNPFSNGFFFHIFNLSLPHHVRNFVSSTVVEGSAKILRANRTEEILQAGQTILLKVGDSLIEPGGMVHYGKNESASVVILISASLFDAKQPKAIPIEP